MILPSVGWHKNLQIYKCIHVSQQSVPINNARWDIELLQRLGGSTDKERTITGFKTLDSFLMMVFENLKELENWNGIVEIITEMTRYLPEIIWSEDGWERSVFAYAILQRQENNFSLIHKMGTKKNYLTASWDRGSNNMLHQAAFLPPSSLLERVPGAALQMQRELQWFKEVESIVTPKYKEFLNVRGQTPEALFRESHKGVEEEGKKWMKGISEYCTVVAALIATIMFSVLPSVPGCFEQITGIPAHLNRKSFIIFFVFDSVSLFSSCYSLPMFLGILSSRYREEDFPEILTNKVDSGAFQSILIYSNHDDHLWDNPCGFSSRLNVLGFFPDYFGCKSTSHSFCSSAISSAGRDLCFNLWAWNFQET